MRRALLILAISWIWIVPLSAQVVVQRPPGIVQTVSCAPFQVLPGLELHVRYRLINVRPNGGTGEWRLRYKPTHFNEDRSFYSQYRSSDVTVEEVYSDMGVWVMRDNWGKFRWSGECGKSASGVVTVWGIAIMGNLQLVEPYDPGCAPESPGPYPTAIGLATSDCDDGGGGGGGSDPGDGGGGDGDSICEEYDLDPGCYDVYVDGIYAGKLCCGDMES